MTFTDTSMTLKVVSMNQHDPKPQNSHTLWVGNFPRMLN